MPVLCAVLAEEVSPAHLSGPSSPRRITRAAGTNGACGRAAARRGGENERMVTWCGHSLYFPHLPSPRYYDLTRVTKNGSVIALVAGGIRTPRLISPPPKLRHRLWLIRTIGVIPSKCWRNGEVAQREFLVLTVGCSVYNPPSVPRVGTRVFVEFIK